MKRRGRRRQSAPGVRGCPPRALLALLAVLALAAGACRSGDAASTGAEGGGAGGTAEPQGGGIFYAYLDQPSSIDPAHAVEPEDLNVITELFDSLTAVDPLLRVLPGAAERWESNANATVFTFHLRPSATFHDGQPVTADAFKRAWQRVIPRPGGPRSAAADLLAPVQGYEQARTGGDLTGVVARDLTTLQVTLGAPFAEFPAVVSHPALGPVPPAAIDDPDGFAQQPIGNGAFRMDGPWQPGQFIRLEAFDGYVGEKPKLDQLINRIYEGDGAAGAGYEDFADGNLDLAPVPPDKMKSATNKYGLSQDGYSGPGVLNGVKLITAFYGFNTERPPFDDPTIRRALSLLIDRDGILKDLDDEARAAAHSIVPPGLEGYQPPECEFCNYDPGRATQLLGGRPIGPLELVYFEGSDHQVVAERVQRDVNVLGPGTLTLRPLPQSEWLDAIRRGDAAFFLSGWIAEYPAAEALLYPLFHQSRIGTDNVTRYKNPEVKALLDQARRELDPAKRAALWHEAEGIVLSDLPVVPLFHYRHARVVAPRVRGFTLSPMGDVDMTQVWLDPKE
ncbi:MAG: ABC transporter substrate-binding protein [Actinomycetota bacterium]|nr:ABC transporter substrate-binding protein [Actinomycetota bacterium]